MDFVKATVIIEDHFKSNWTQTPITFDNVNYNPIRGTSFLSVQIIWADTVSISVGTKDRGYGYIMTNVFTPINIGSRTALGYANSISDLFDRYTYENFTCLTSEISNVIPNNNEFYQVNVKTDFYIDDCF